jgi:hypothetical protein
MAVVINDINRLQEINIGGVEHIQLIDFKSLPNLNIINQEISTDLGTDTWSNIFPSVKSIDFSISVKAIKGIDVYYPKVLFTVPKHRLSIDLTIQKLKRTRWALLLRGANGDKVLVGTKDAPLKFTEIDIKYKNKATQRNAYRLQFSGASTIKPVFYTYVEPVVALDNDYMLWEDGSYALWEDGTLIEFEN